MGVVDAEGRCDVARGGAIEEHAEDREVVGVELQSRCLEQRLGDQGEDDAACRDGADGFEELLGAAALVDEAVGPATIAGTVMEASAKAE
jgi:hypothetical protein